MYSSIYKVLPKSTTCLSAERDCENVRPLDLSATMLKVPDRSSSKSADPDSDAESSCDDDTTSLLLSEGSIYRSRARRPRYAVRHVSGDLPRVTADGSMAQAETSCGDITPDSTAHENQPEDSFDPQSDSSSSVSSMKAHQGTPKSRLQVRQIASPLQSSVTNVCRAE
jgi:hypothetical protein